MEATKTSGALSQAADQVAGRNGGTRAQAPAEQARPEDWPGPGPIDLAQHDLPHRSSALEWWYLNGHLEVEDGRQLSLFASFFRLVVDYDEQTRTAAYGHSLTWGLIDPRARGYRSEGLIDRCAPRVGMRRLDRGEEIRDERLRRALREVFQQGRIPLPDLLCTRDGATSLERLDLDVEGNTLRKGPGGSYRLQLADRAGQVGATLTFHPQKPPARHGDAGVVRGALDEDMFYYFISRCRVEGEVVVDGTRLAVRRGSGWYDHEFGRPNEVRHADGGAGRVAWHWLAAQLDNGCEVSAYDLFDLEQGGSCGRWLIVIDAEGLQREYADFDLEPLERWTSGRTFIEHPVRWRLHCAAAGLSLEAAAAFPQQEFITIISKPAFWEGRIDVSGTMAGRPVAGPGFVECSGFGDDGDLEGFFGAVGRQTRRAIERLLPLAPTPDQARRLVASDATPHLLDGFDVEHYARVVLRPIREVVDRGGKAWRSYALLACCDIVGGDPNEWIEWLAVPELLHVGSLIVDDVQDGSLVRRGGPTAHVVHGQALAINAGNAAYFLVQSLYYDYADKLSPRDTVRIYNLYFEGLRAAHAGQGLDIAGQHALLPAIVANGDGALLERRVLAVHRLKSAVPARALGQMGAILGGGSDEQIEALGRFLEHLGLAFQVVDDVLNLRGFRGDLKSRGEDLAHGKITMPVARALSLLPPAGRQALLRDLSACAADGAALERAIAAIDGCGALDACSALAEQLVESGWRGIDPLFPDSHVKAKLRAFGWFVLERHY